MKKNKFDNKNMVQKKYKNEKKEKFEWKNLLKDPRVIWILIGIVICFVVSSFSKKDASIPLPEQFDAAAVEEEAKQIVTYFNERDYQSILAMSPGLMDEAYTLEEFTEKCDPYVDELGQFKEFGEIQMNGYVNEETKEEYARAKFTVKYENGDAQFAFAFSEDMHLVTFGVQ